MLTLLISFSLTQRETPISKKKKKKKNKQTNNNNKKKKKKKVGPRKPKFQKGVAVHPVPMISAKLA